ncbi:FabD/lysophospholipase-like protein [Ceratobasidium sp. AG-I]|nr:FabD/lysophospholipase-like protein [Ceratobasidium sp. AG-I]
MSTGPTGGGVRVLSLDGGGISVLGALSVVHESMNRLKDVKNLSDLPRPCDVYEFMSGTGMGAVAVILLGRLRLDTIAATKSFKEISEQTFSTKKRLSRDSVYSASALEKVAGEIVARYCGTADAKMLDTSSNALMCKVMICASTAHALRAGIPTCIRSYPVSANQGPNCTIVEAIRATTAAPGLFKRAIIKENGIDIPYVGGGLECNNPTDIALREVSSVFPNSPIACVMSVGAGRLHSASIPDARIYDAWLPSRLIPAVQKIATDCERTHQDLARRFDHTKGAYFRFSTDQGIQDIDQYNATKVSEVQAHTRQYLQDASVNSRMQDAVKAIAAGVGVVTINQSNIQPMVPTTSRVGRCPPPSRAFIGREDILNKMDSYFSGTGSLERRLFVLHGLGGAGKTQLALKFIHTHQAWFWDIFYIDATTRETISAGLIAIGRAVNAGSTPDEALAWLVSQQKRWLLVFNNADDPNLNLHDFFPECAHGDILITTRNQQMVTHTTEPESDYRVGGMKPDDALQLFLKTSRADDKEETIGIAKQLVGELGYFALAIVQSGAYMRARQCGVAEYFQIFQSARARLLRESPSIQADNYKLSVFATWGISHRQLLPRAAQLLQIMSFLHHEGISEGFFEAASTRAMSYKSHIPLTESQATRKSIIFDLLSSLRTSSHEWDPLALKDLTDQIRAFSLLDYDTNTRSYSMHPLVQEWCRATTSDVETVRECSMWVLSLCVKWQHGSEDYALRRRLLPHLVALDVDHTHMVPELADWLRLVYSEAGYAKEEGALLAIALQASRDAFGNEHPTALTCMHNVAGAYRRRGRLEEAVALLAWVVAVRKRVLGHEHSDTLTSMHSLAYAYRYQKRWKEAEALFLEVIELEKRVNGAEHSHTLSSIGELASTYRSQGRLSEAEALQVEVLETSRRVLGREHPNMLVVMHNLALTYEDQGKPQEAESLMAQTVILSKRIRGESHAWTQNSVRSLDKIQQRMRSKILPASVP